VAGILFLFASLWPRSAMALVYKMTHLIAGVLVKCIVSYGTLRPYGVVIFLFVCLFLLYHAL